MKIQPCLCGVEKYSKLAQIAKNLDTNLTILFLPENELHFVEN